MRNPGLTKGRSASITRWIFPLQSSRTKMYKILFRTAHKHGYDSHKGEHSNAKRSATGIGMYLVAYVAPGIDDRLAARIAYTSGVDTVPLSTFSVRRLRRGGLVLGYSAYDAKSIRAATKQLCDAL